MQQLVGLSVIDDSLGLRVPVDPGFRSERYVGQQGKRRRAVPRFHIAIRLLSALDAVTEVANVLDRKISVHLCDFQRLDLWVALVELPAFRRHDLVRSALCAAIEIAQRASQLDLSIHQGRATVRFVLAED